MWLLSGDFARIKQSEKKREHCPCKANEKIANIAHITIGESANFTHVKQWKNNDKTKKKTPFATRAFFDAIIYVA